jgi:hypothetical protein
MSGAIRGAGANWRSCWLTTAVRKKTPQPDLKPFKVCGFRPLWHQMPFGKAK